MNLGWFNCWTVAVKVPQIGKLMKARSGEGISIVGTTLELLAVTSTLAYGYRNNFPFRSDINHHVLVYDLKQ